MSEVSFTSPVMLSLIEALSYVIVIVLLLIILAAVSLLALQRVADWARELSCAYDRLRLGIWVYLACRARQRERPLDIGTYEILDPTERMRRSCAQLIELAEETGQVVTITTEPVPGTPLAMGNYRMQYHVRPARVDGKYGATPS